MSWHRRNPQELRDEVAAELKACPRGARRSFCYGYISGTIEHADKLGDVQEDWKMLESILQEIGA
jgi:hypothetical protein